MTNFEKAMKPLTYSRSPWQVWEDWTYLTAATISAATDRRPERENRCKEIAAKYSGEQMKAMAEMFGCLVEELDREPEQDFLGKLYMQLGLGDHWKGQFFTPYSVCVMMADMSVKVKEDGITTISDSACGGGATLIAAFHAARKQLEKVGKNAQQYVLIAAQDISQMTACMCYIQLSLLGIAAVVKVGDTLADPLLGNPLLLEPSPSLWFTPMYYLPIWTGRRICAALDAVLKVRDKT